MQFLEIISDFLNKNLSENGKKTEVLNLQDNLISFKEDSNLILVTSLDSLYKALKKSKTDWNILKLIQL